MICVCVCVRNSVTALRMSDCWSNFNPDTWRESKTNESPLNPYLFESPTVYII